VNYIKNMEFEIADILSLEEELFPKIRDHAKADVQCKVRMHGVPYKEVESHKDLFIILSYSLGITSVLKTLEIFGVETRNVTNTLVPDSQVLDLSVTSIRENVATPTLTPTSFKNSSIKILVGWYFTQRKFVTQTYNAHSNRRSSILQFSNDPTN